MTTTIPTARIINNLKAAGLNRKDFSITANRRRVKGENGKKHTEFLPGNTIVIFDTYGVREHYDQILHQGLDLIFSFDFSASGDQPTTSLIPAQIQENPIDGQGKIYFIPLQIPQEVLLSDRPLQDWFDQEYTFQALDKSGNSIISVRSKLLFAGEEIRRELHKNPSRTPYYNSWLEGNCQIRIQG